MHASANVGICWPGTAAGFCNSALTQLLLPPSSRLRPVPCRRGQLKALVDIHGAEEGLGGNLSEDEIKVICGALDLTNKTARK
jgi:hypothetical protein